MGKLKIVNIKYVEKEYKLNFDEIRKEFYKKYTPRELRKQLESFIAQKLDLCVLDDTGKKYDKLINHFFEEIIYSCKSSRGNMTPSDALLNDDILKKIFDFIETKPDFFAKEDGYITNLKKFFQCAGRIASKVANFSPNVARKIYEYYLPKTNGVILDYSCGFGSRMLGALSSRNNYFYYGIEPNTKLYAKLNEFGVFINGIKPSKYKLFNQGSEDEIPELVGKVDLAFSSPPYFDLEYYTNEPTQSIVKYSDYASWLFYYVGGTIANIYKYLKDDGIFIVNIKNLTSGNKYPLLDDWIKIAKNIGFTLVEIRDMNHQHSRDSLAKYKSELNQSYEGGTEPIAIFTKGNVGLKVKNLKGKLLW